MILPIPRLIEVILEILNFVDSMSTNDAVVSPDHFMGTLKLFLEIIAMAKMFRIEYRSMMMESRRIYLVFVMQR